MPTPAPVQPLRIQKNGPSPSPGKTSLGQRPLSEINPMERRRNSPSFNQTTKKPMLNNSSPFDSSPFNSSPKMFWQGKEPLSANPISYENSPMGRDSSPSPTRRSSIENLKKASRVKNSSMFAREQQHEYDPASAPVSLERPLASGRPLNSSIQGLQGARGNENGSQIPVLSPTRTPTKTNGASTETPSPSKNKYSPTKSSLSNPGRFTANPPKFDPENGTWSEENSGSERQLPAGRMLHSHAKSVTFDAAPPQVNEYEMTTPDLSSLASGSREGSYDSAIDEDESFERIDLMGRDDSFDASLEDTQKTPVVGPDDWRHMSPRAANANLAMDIEDPFDPEDGSPRPTGKPKSANGECPSPSRTDSDTSNGERRPLPPLPGLMSFNSNVQSNSPDASSKGIESYGSGSRHLPSTPRPASITKSEIQSLSGNKMSLEERLRLMMLQDTDNAKDEHDAQRERRMRRATSREKNIDRSGKDSVDDIKIHEDEIERQDFADPSEYKFPPRISRESILRKVKSKAEVKEDDVDDYYSSPVPGSSPDRQLAPHFDPDTPLPSRELEYTLEETEVSIVIKEEVQDGREIDLASIPDFQNGVRAASTISSDGEDDGETSVLHHETTKVDDEESDYSHESAATINKESGGGMVTPRASTPQQSNMLNESQIDDSRISLPQFDSVLDEDDFGLGLQSYMSPSPKLTQQSFITDSAPRMSSFRDYLQQDATTPEESESSSELAAEPAAEKAADPERPTTPQTPEPVNDRQVDSVSPPQQSPGIPEPVATIKAPGGRLKTRPSVTPADMATMAAARRQFSGEKSAVPGVPPIPERHRNRPSLTTDAEDRDAMPPPKQMSSRQIEINRRKSLVKLEMPVPGSEEDLSFGIDKAFDRIKEAQKRGYLMRQNTKVIVASSNVEESAPDLVDAKQRAERGTRSAGNSPRKTSHDRTKSWSVEPWNGKMRRNSIKVTTPSPKKRLVPGSGAVPPLPGMEINVSNALNTVAEDAALPEEPEAGSERGRLFVKVVGIKDMDLPLPRGEKTWFCLTLDNGLHCVTTAFLELGKNAPIGQEFELVVLDDLEFMLTLQAKVEKPVTPSVSDSPSKASRAQKSSTFSRVFASPKKRKELEKQQQDEEQRVKQRASDAMAKQPTSYDLLKNIVSQDEKEKGNFARAYVCLKDYESNAYGRPLVVDAACFNEWATEEVSFNSSLKSSKRGPPGLQRKAPYRIGKIELQLLFVPKPKDASDEEMPKSMNACIRELRDAEANANRVYEGHLSQQGGDCPYWRRRFFKLSGTKLTAYHEATRQPRATINLAKASKLIDDPSSLTKKDVSTKSGSRRKSAFAEEEEGYMFVEEGFRIRFANGEVIDFYADCTKDKEGWMEVLEKAVGKGCGSTDKKGWADLVLAKERRSTAMGKIEGNDVKVSLMQSPAKKPRRTTDTSTVPTPMEKDPLVQRRGRKGIQPKSMIF